MAETENAFYPYKKIIAANTIKGAELIPQKILLYLLDLPDAKGHVPFQSNDNPRARLMRYLWNDGPRPLEGPLPTPEQKLSMLFDADHPDINTDEYKAKHPKGYRIFAQRNIGQSVLYAKTMLKVYVGRVLDPTDFRTVIGLQAEIWSNVNFIANTRTSAYDRVFDIEQCLREALAGVDIAGVGCCRFSRQESSFNGSEVLYTDADMVGRMVYFSTSWSEGGGGVVSGGATY